MFINEANNYISSLCEFPNDEVYLLAIQKYDIDIVKFILYDKYGFEPTIDDIDLDDIRDQIKRIGQKEFRLKIIKKYKRCIITQDFADICEACHIVPYNECKSYNIDNGLLLTASLHKLFDNYMMTIDAITHCVKMKNKNHSYAKYDKMHIPNLSPKTSEYLAVHNKMYDEN